MDIRMIVFNVTHDGTLELSPKIEVFKPYQIGKIPDTLNNSFHIGNTREYRLHETHGTYSCFIHFSHSRNSPLDTYGTVHILAELFVQGIYRP